MMVKDVNLIVRQLLRAGLALEGQLLVLTLALYVETQSRRAARFVMTAQMMGKDVYWGALEKLLAGIVLIMLVEIRLVCLFVGTEESFCLNFVTTGPKIIPHLLML